MENICPKYRNCRLFNGHLLKRKQSEEAYKNLYCQNYTEKNWEQCKRYQVSERIGETPDWVMPNSGYSIDEIVQKLKTEN